VLVGHSRFSKKPSGIPDFQKNHRAFPIFKRNIFSKKPSGIPDMLLFFKKPSGIPDLGHVRF